MHSYSPLFQTIYDEQAPVIDLGRGTHYSILRAVVWNDWNDGDNNVSRRAKYLDFAIIWDEDHDDRIINVLEEIYLFGYLSLGTIFGERKGGFTFVLNDGFELSDFKKIFKDIENIIDSSEDDTWCFDMDYLPYVYEDEYGESEYNSDVLGIINASDEDVIKYLKDISEKWELGLKDIKKEEIWERLFPSGTSE